MSQNIVIPTDFPKTFKEVEAHLDYILGFLEIEPEIAKNIVGEKWLEGYLRVMELEGDAKKIGMVCMSVTWESIIRLANEE